jgi:DNA-binding NarL/FixJ family response regulator
VYPYIQVRKSLLKGFDWHTIQVEVWVKPRLLLADESKMMAESMRLLLEPEFEVVDVVGDGRALVALAETLKPDVVLLEVSLPELNGIEAAHHLRKILPGVCIIFVARREDTECVARAFRAGASGYVPKRAAASELLTAIREAMKGNQYLSPLLARDALASWVSGAETPGKFGRRLTPRQREVLQLVAEGKTRKEIASLLKVSVKTVEFHKSALMRELRLKTTAELTRYAIEQGLISADGPEPGL